MNGMSEKDEANYLAESGNTIKHKRERRQRIDHCLRSSAATDTTEEEERRIVYRVKLLRIAFFHFARMKRDGKERRR
jgi:hypothetical protein